MMGDCWESNLSPRERGKTACRYGYLQEGLQKQGDRVGQTYARGCQALRSHLGFPLGSLGEHDQASALFSDGSSNHVSAGWVPSAPPTPTSVLVGFHTFSYCCFSLLPLFSHRSCGFDSCWFWWGCFWRGSRPRGQRWVFSSSCLRRERDC